MLRLMVFGNMRKRHILLLTGVLALVVGAILTSVTISRIYWYSPIYFYRYTAHPFTAAGIFLCSLGAFFVLLYIMIKIWEMFKARKAAQRKAEADREAATRKAEAARAKAEAEEQGAPTSTK
jgi:type VI protein secretion system component VasK